jgi:hypothetical protein
MVLYSVLLRTPAAAPVISAVAKLGIGVFILIPRSLAVSVRRYGQKTAGLAGEFLPATICLHDRSLRTAPGHRQRSRYGSHRMGRSRPGRSLTPDHWTAGPA